MLIINKHFNFCCFRALAYTTLDRLCAVFLYNICCVIKNFLLRDVWQSSNVDNSANKWVLHRLKLQIWKLRALIDISVSIMYIRVIYTSLFITTMTSRKKISGFEFWSRVIYAWPWCICPPNFAQISLSNSKLLTFSEIQDGGSQHLGFSSRVHLEHSVKLIAWCLSCI